MNLKLLPRERLLLLAALLAVAFYIIWSVSLNPMLVSIGKYREKISIMNNQIRLYESSQKLLKKLPAVKRPKIVNYAKDEQMSYMIDFVSANMKGRHIKLLNLRQDASSGDLNAHIAFRGQFDDVLAFLNSLRKFRAVYAVDSVSMLTENTDVAVDMVVRTKYTQ